MLSGRSRPHLLDKGTLFRHFMNSLSDLLRQPSGGVLQTGRIKIFPDGSATILCAQKPVFRPAGWELEDRIISRRDTEKAAGGDVGRSQRRARAAVFDLARSNSFDWFVTLTLDKEKIDRYDIAVIVEKLNIWLDNNVRRRGLRYLLIPEHHKDGAIHFHGFFNDALKAVFSGVYDKRGHEIYNLPRWGYGFSTAIRLYGDYHRAVGYVCKYVTKQQEKIGGRWYYSGGELKRSDVHLCDIDFDEMAAREGAYVFEVAPLGTKICRVDVRNFFEPEKDGF